MLEGKDLILATRKYAKEDRARSWRVLISTTILLFLTSIGGIINFHIIPQLICAILTGLLIVRFFIIYHDYMHKAILQHSGFAKALFTLLGLFILAPSSIWKRSHDHHHVHNSKLYTSSIGSFPLVTKKEYLQGSRLERRIYLFIRHPITILFGYVFAFIWGFCIRTLVKSADKHMDALVALLFHFGVGVAVYFTLGLQSFLIGFLIPSFMYGAMGSYLFYAQHNFPDAKFKRKEEWNYTFAALRSSSYMKMSKVMHWFTGNIGYHHIHHINSKIPFYKLPTVFKEMPELQHPGTTSLMPWDVYRCLKIKAWDHDTDQMIGLKEIRRAMKEAKKYALVKNRVFMSTSTDNTESDKELDGS